MYSLKILEYLFKMYAKYCVFTTGSRNCDTELIAHSLVVMHVTYVVQLSLVNESEN